MKKYRLKKEKCGYLNMVKSLFEKFPITEYTKSYIILNGNKEVQINNCKEILVYNENILKVEMSNYFIIIEGTDLTMETLLKGSIIVNGRIFSLKYVYER